MFDEMMVDTLYQYLINQGSPKSKEVLLDEHNNRADKHDNILLSVDTQCDWLREIGYDDVDCFFFKCFELAIFAGRKK
ncbi:hypothetical protein EDD69_1252 [Thermolongibacillus altinsuensis]|uniref:tRNA (Cmo5U34)-methyltransferase n=1 Tax=Thermolongibacillus altinsuensis TaxID=575256 RepID=A0A4R1Q9G9_9BACL|nr:hypothetical protein EDD69_1252 [Thermolongibacillus altinsuensis]